MAEERQFDGQGHSPGFIFEFCAFQTPGKRISSNQNVFVMVGQGKLGMRS